MPCERYKAALIESAASGTALGSTASVHLESCTSCRELFEREQALLAAIDAGLNVAANSKVLASLLPRVREQLNDQTIDRGPLAAVRMGLRVPIETSAGATAKQVQYMDVGTNLDGRAEKTEDNRFLLKLNVEKSSVYTPGLSPKPASLGGNGISSGQPVVQQFRSQVSLLIRDGQTVQSTVATDPVTGHVLKVDVTLNVIK